MYVNMITMKIKLNIDFSTITILPLLQKIGFSEDDIQVFNEKYITLYNALFLEHVFTYVSEEVADEVRMLINSGSEKPEEIEEKVTLLYKENSMSNSPKIGVLADSAKILAFQVIFSELMKVLSPERVVVVNDFFNEISKKVASGIAMEE